MDGDRDPARGRVSIADWWPDATALLLSQLLDGRHRLHRFELATGTRTRIEHPEGQVEWAQVRPDGVVWFRHSSGSSAPGSWTRPVARCSRSRASRHPPAGPSSSWASRIDTVSPQGFLVTPAGTGPWPILVRPHGGPTWLDEDKWHPEVQSYVDAGLAVVLVNYRGSTGRGAEWRDTLVGDVGGPELEDLNDALDHLVAAGIADPERAAVGGWSWGGYLTLMMLGKHPERDWRCGIAGVPVGDYELSYDDMSPLLQAYDRALLGGRPDQVPELMADRNPINSADDVEAPVLFLIGEHDSRCPYRQAMAYVDRLRARDHPHEVYLFATGHGSFDIEEEIRQQRTILGYLAEHVPRRCGPNGLSRYRGLRAHVDRRADGAARRVRDRRVGIAMLRSLTMSSPTSASDEPAPRARGRRRSRCLPGVRGVRYRAQGLAFGGVADPTALR